MQRKPFVEPISTAPPSALDAKQSRELEQVGAQEADGKRAPCAGVAAAGRAEAQQAAERLPPSSGAPLSLCGPAALPSAGQLATLLHTPLHMHATHYLNASPPCHGSLIVLLALPMTHAPPHSPPWLAPCAFTHMPSTSTLVLHRPQLQAKIALPCCAHLAAYLARVSR